jgi:hypothetical protein
MAPKPPEEPKPFEWAAAQVGDHLPDGRGVIIGKGIASKAQAKILAVRENGTVWPDGPGRWAVVVPERWEDEDEDQAALLASSPTPGGLSDGVKEKAYDIAIMVTARDIREQNRKLKVLRRIDAGETIRPEDDPWDFRAMQQDRRTMIRQYLEQHDAQRSKDAQ